MSDVFPDSGFSISTPIDTFEHDQSGSIIEVVSTVHVGSPIYYSALYNHLQRRIDDGFTVYLEGIRESSPEELASMSRIDRFKEKLLDRQAMGSFDLFQLMEDSTGFISQSDLMDKLDSGEGTYTRNVDTSVAELARKSAIHHLLGGLLSQRALYKKIEDSKDTGGDQVVYDEIARQVEEAKRKSQSEPSGRRRIMITERNQGVLKAVDDHLAEDQSARVALLWGFGHLAGLADGIKAKGYRNSSRKFLTVAFNPNLFQLDRSIS